MANRLRFHLDEQVNPRIAQGLRRRGIDVTTTVGAGLRTVADDVQLAFARQALRVLAGRSKAGDIGPETSDQV